MMSVGGGLSLLERLALSARTSMIPIIVLTASDDPAVKARALGAGATRVLRKPCDTERLLEAAEAALGGGG